MSIIINFSNFLGLLEQTAFSFFSENFWVFLIYTGSVGAINLSFGGVVVDRLPFVLRWRDPMTPTQAQMSLCFPASRCNSCHHRLSMIQLIPIIGWLIYRGQCPYCGASVPVRYPFMEALGALVSIACALRFGVSGTALWAMLLAQTMLVLAWLDWREQWVPDIIGIPLILIGLCWTPFALGDDAASMRIYGMAAAMTLIFVSQYFTGKILGIDLVMGGDIVYAAIAGAWLGIAAVPVWTAALVVSYGIYAGINRVRGQVMTPMGPAATCATLVCLWFYQDMSLSLYRF